MRLSRRIVLLSLLTFLFSPPLLAQTLTVRVPQGNVRAGPGTTHEVVGTVQRGEKYQVQSQEGDWFKVLLETGREGWVLKSLVEVAGGRSGGTERAAPPAGRPASGRERVAWRSAGSGFILMGTSRVLTSHHVVQGAESLRVSLPSGEVYPGTVVARDANNDLALVLVQGMKPKEGGFVPRLEAEVKPGEQVHALGYPLGATLSRRPSIVSGQVSAATGLQDNIAQFRTTAPINEGNSGGPFVNAYGALVGVASSGLVQQGVEAVRFATKISAASLLLAQGRLARLFSVTVQPRPDRPLPPEEIFRLYSPYVVLIERGSAVESPPPPARPPVAPPAPPVASIPQQRGDLYVSSDPAGARVFLDGRDTGRDTPVFLEGIASGGRRVEARKGDHMVASGDVDVVAGAINRMQLKLEVLQGRLKVVSEPLEAEVFVDGKTVGKTPLIASVPGGPRSVRVQKEGYEPFERKVEVSIRRENSLLAVLVVEKVPPAPGMVSVPAGWFIMGSNDGEGNEKPQRRVYLDAFYIDKYPVTNAQFRRFGKPQKDYGKKFNGDKQPVVGVTWHQVNEYCQSVGKRLPTEAEWEKAARGVDGRKYPWGNEWDESKLILSKNSSGRTHPVDRTYNTHRSPYGAVDMAGNVYQWVGDWYDANYYRAAPDRNPKGPASGSGRILRGGAWGDDGPSSFRAAYRFGDPPDRWYIPVGFRCAEASR